MAGKNYFLFIFYIFISIHGMEAQGFNDKSDTAEADQLYIHIDKSFYSNGENIWYKIYILNNGKEQDFSKVVYVDFLSSNGKLILQQKLKVKGRIAYGDIALPLDIEEGYYYLKASTIWNKNFNSQNNYLVKVPIYSEWEEASHQTIQEQVELNNEISSIYSSHSQGISIAPEKSPYKRNELVTINFKATDKTGKPVKANLSVAVTEKDLIPEPNSYGIIYRKAALEDSKENENIIQKKYTKEQGLRIKGFISDPATGDPLNTRFLSIYTPGISEFKSSEIEKGILDHTLPDFYGTQIIQFHNFDPYQNTIPKVKIEKNDWNWENQEIKMDYPSRDPTIEKYLEAARLRRKINEVFEVKDQVDISVAKTGLSNFTGDKVFLMKDYHLMKDVEEFIRIFFFKTRIKEKGGKKSVILYNYDSKYNFMESPWYLLDGYLTRDENFLLKIPLKNVEKIEIFYRTKTLSGQFDALMIRSGVLAIHTKEKGLLLPKLDLGNNVEVTGYYSPRKFKIPIVNEPYEEHPDFRPLIYWNPEIITDENGMATITFQASSSIGDFNIIVEGISPTGEIVQGFETFRTGPESLNFNFQSK
ncbi:hypothetical protein BH23BAC1_BH23BAC1_49410 [soil metagenome]